MSTVARPRLVSVDVMRGATMAAMIVVNNPGSWAHMAPALKHAAWGQWLTPADLVFPFFLFLVGVARLLRDDTEGALRALDEGYRVSVALELPVMAAHARALQADAALAQDDEHRALHHIRELRSLASRYRMDSIATAASDAVPTPASTRIGTAAFSTMVRILSRLRMPRPEPMGAARGMTAAARASRSCLQAMRSALV